MHIKVFEKIVVLSRHCSAHIKCSQSEMEASLMKEFVLSWSWVDCIFVYW